jgi:hypothetical protein
MKPAAALRTSSYFSLLYLKRHMMYYLDCSYPLTVDGTKVKVQVKQFHYRLGQAHRISGG